MSDTSLVMDASPSLIEGQHQWRQFRSRLLTYAYEDRSGAIVEFKGARWSFPRRLKLGKRLVRGNLVMREVSSFASVILQELLDSWEFHVGLVFISSLDVHHSARVDAFEQAIRESKGLARKPDVDEELFASVGDGASLIWLNPEPKPADVVHQIESFAAEVGATIRVCPYDEC